MTTLRTMVGSEYRYVYSVLAIVLVAHLLSFFYIAHLASLNPAADPYPIVKGDSHNYAAMADALLAHGVFSLDPNLSPERHWPPGYAIFLAETKAVSGGFTFAVILQTLATLGAVVLIYAMARRFLSPMFASVPALLYGIDPSVILADTTIITDGLFSTLIIGAVYMVFFVEVRGREILRWIIVGGLLAVATSMRSIAEFLIPLIPFIFILRYGFMQEMSKYRRVFVPFFAYLFVVSLVLVPWVVRNYRNFGVFEIAHVGASNILGYNARGFLAWREMNQEGRHVSAITAVRLISDPAYAVVDKKIAADLTSMTPVGADPDNYESALAEHLIFQHPIQYAYFHLVNTIPFFIGSSIAGYRQMIEQERNNTGYFAPTSTALSNTLHQLFNSRDFFGSLPMLKNTVPILVEVLIWAVICVSTLAALFERKYRASMLIFGILVIYFAILTGPVSIVRYRIPAEPYLLIMAVVGARWGAVKVNMLSRDKL